MVICTYPHLLLINFVAGTEIFDDAFISHLFDLVEQTRNALDETFNYSVIKLLVSDYGVYTQLYRRLTFLLSDIRRSR